MNSENVILNDYNLSKLESQLEEYKVMETDMENSLIEMKKMLDDITVKKQEK